MGECIIRLADTSDASAIAAIYGPFVERTVISFETAAPSAADMRTRIVETTATHPWLVCERGGEIAGYAYATQHRTRAAYRWSVDTSVYVAPLHHRCGVARGLYASLFAVLTHQGFINAYAGITLPNAASVGVHEAVGFTPIGVYRQVGFKMGAWHDVGWWQLALGAHADLPAEPLPLQAAKGADGWEARVRTGESLVRPWRG